jgi:hypothetical protein
LVPRGLSDGLEALRTGDVDAVLWAGGSPTAMIRKEIVGTPPLDIRLLPLADYLDAVQNDFDDYYRSILGPGFRGRRHLRDGDDQPGGLPGGGAGGHVRDPRTGWPSTKAQTGDLVGFVAGSLVRDRADFERALWEGEQGARHFRDVREAVGGSPVYCLVRLHSAAESAYREIGVSPSCRP